MNKNEKDFIDLVSFYLNSSTPENNEYDWKEIFNLAYINNIVGIISSQIVALPNVDKKIKLHYKKYVAKSVVDYEHRQKAKDELKAFFEENNFDYMFVKGMAINEYYPVPELRTSGDIDVVVREKQFEDIVSVYKSTNKPIESLNGVTLIIPIDDVTVEIHRNADVFGSYFDDIFDRTNQNDHLYSLDLYNQLLYILLHLVKHLRSMGAGIRMLMDMDVCVRAIDNFDQQKFLNMCKEAGIEYCAKVILSLCNYWFNTPISPLVDMSEKQELVELLSNVFLHGGTFGYENNSYAGRYLAISSKNGQIGKREKIKAIIGWIFPPVWIIKRTFGYAIKYPILIPFAYAHRFVIAVFKHKKHLSTTAKGIINPNSAPMDISKIRFELNIDD